MNTKAVGSIGEIIAENFLCEKGYEILDRNFVFRIPGNPQKGEIDIVAQKSGVISFIEVKTLRQFPSAVFLPEDKVDFQKQRKLRLAAESWLMKKSVPLNSKWQIDVIAIEINGGEEKISHFENAVGYC